MNDQRNNDLSGLDRGDSSLPLHRNIVVDDDPGSRTLCRQVLESEGIVCDEAADGIQALTLMASGNYDLVLLDIDMPKMQGTEVLRRLRENPPGSHLKVIMLSGRATEDEMALMMRAGADDYLSKPFSLVQMRERVKSALRLKVAQERSDLGQPKSAYGQSPTGTGASCS